jgi:hypothetical protein
MDSMRITSQPRPGGRPRLAEPDRKTNILTLRFTDGQLRALQARAEREGYPEGTPVRKIVLASMLLGLAYTPEGEMGDRLRAIPPADAVVPPEL